MSAAWQTQMKNNTPTAPRTPLGLRICVLLNRRYCASPHLWTNLIRLPQRAAGMTSCGQPKPHTNAARCETLQSSVTVDAGRICVVPPFLRSEAHDYHSGTGCKSPKCSRRRMLRSKHERVTSQFEKSKKSPKASPALKHTLCCPRRALSHLLCTRTKGTAKCHRDVQQGPE
jgi:hypothetical protein